MQERSQIAIVDEGWLGDLRSVQVRGRETLAQQASKRRDALYKTGGTGMIPRAMPGSERGVDREGMFDTVDLRCFPRLVGGRFLPFMGSTNSQEEVHEHG